MTCVQIRDKKRVNCAKIIMTFVPKKYTRCKNKNLVIFMFILKFIYKMLNTTNYKQTKKIYLLKKKK